MHGRFVIPILSAPASPWGGSEIEPPADAGPLYQLATAVAAALTSDEVVTAVAEHAGWHFGATQAAHKPGPNSGCPRGGKPLPKAKG